METRVSKRRIWHRNYLMGSRAKKHHIVPEVLQRQFAIDGSPKNVWRAKKDETGKFREPERKRIASAFVIRDYYTVLEGDRRSDRIEREFYGPIDDFLGRFLPEVLCAFRIGKIPRLSSEALDSVRQVAIALAKRTPDFLKEHDDIEMGRKLIESCLEALPNDATVEERQTFEAALKDEEKLRDRGRSIRVKALLRGSPAIDKALPEFVPRWAVSETKHSFILSSMMAYRIGNGGPNGLSNPNMEIWMPISPKIALVLLRDPNNRVPPKVVDSPKHIREINQYAVANSFEIASHSEELLRSLLGR